MPIGQNNASIVENIPLIEIEAGNEVRETPTRINFYSDEALDIGYLWKIHSLLEEHGYDSNNLRLTSKRIGSQVFAHRENRELIIDGEKENLKYSLECGNLDGKTKNEIEKLLEGIPYVRLSCDF